MAEQSSADFRGNLGRYALYGEIAAGGMATVHLARLLGPVGFARTVAIKRLHPHLAKDPDFVGMFLEEARLAARVRHPNVVTTLDVVSDDGELFLVMEYVAGESLSRLVRKSREAGKRLPSRYAIGIIAGALDGLHAAHEAKSERGQPLGLVHRDVSPQNFHVGIDGVPRVLDFGIAKATNRVQETRTDQIKGKVAYMSPEQLAKGNIDRRADVYSASVVLWEALTGQRLFKADDVPSLVYAIINEEVQPPSSVAEDLPPEIDAIVMRGLSRDAEERWPSALAMAEALERIVSPAPPREIGAWVEATAGDALAWRQELVHRIESETSSSLPPPMRRDSPAGPIEVTSGVRKADGDAAEPVEYIGGGDFRGVQASRGDEEPLMVALDGPRPLDLAAPKPAKSRSTFGMIAAMVAATLLVIGGGLFVLRWLQMSADSPAGTTNGPPENRLHPPDSAEPAIVIGGAHRTPGPASASATASAKPPPPWLAPPVAPPRGPPPPPVHDECENPFIVDSRGIRHPKPQCFKR